MRPIARPTWVLAVSLGSLWLATSAPVSAPAQQTPAESQAERPFAEWLVDLRAEAVARGIRRETVEQALANLEPVSTIVQRDRTQAELVLSLDRYLTRRLTPRMIRTARLMAARHADLLRRVAAHYGVPARIIVAVWGLESNFGRFSGVRPTIPALATLAYDPRRSALFRRELFSALEILDRGDIDLAELKGSWAGAMGQPQFMPSSYLQYAQDFDGDGRRDIWHSEADVFASIANYLKGFGWSDSQTWGREVRVSPAVAVRILETLAQRTGTCQATRQMTEALPLVRWRALGVRLPNGRALPPTPLNAPLNASLVRAGKRSFLVYANYDALLGYNCAHAYALSAGLLADRIVTR